ncbi:hypothetical protein CLU97_0760 [Chryseobacterium sp. 7]|uniref:hypothetical protein n=1 Tax=Chryseobacterium sp. 7 TaxID=2035214 RepID=UPI000EAD5C3A|nr:hypothetical protein [Chryseobacterium sp. 7]RLJ31347.1 hypothetical protein CLU97_0760 [Chryseobacterium sp. 7]
MKKIIIASLLMTSAVVFAKTEEPKMKTDLSKNHEKVLVAKKDVKEEKKVIKIGNAKVMNPFQQCVFNNSMSISLMYLSMGIPTADGFVEAAATASCIASGL